MQLLGLKLIYAEQIIRKNLELNHLYKFVDFNENDKSYEDKYTDLFSLNKSSINISISCIVGRNGTGKSSILEIIYRIINNLSFDILERDKTDLCYAAGFHAQLFVEINTKIAIIEINNKEDFLYIFEEQQNGSEQKCYCLNKEKLPEYIISELAYTIVNNYGVYSFNQADYFLDDKINGDWLEKLFHKNDGYLTPLVINPMRDYWGSIDNENEAELSISRVNAMFLYFFKEKGIELLKDYSIKGVSINFQEFKIGVEREGKIDKSVHIIFGKKHYNPNIESSMELFDSLSEYIRNNFLDIFGDNETDQESFSDIWKNNFSILESAYNYLAYKILKIAATYDRWNEYFYIEKNNNCVNAKELLNEICRTRNQRDHVTLKLWQCIEFIKNPSLYLIKEKIIPLEKFNPAEKSLDDYFCILPPSFMNPQVVLTKESNEDITLNQLSSGEKQSIFSFSYIIYHIKNVLSKSIAPNYNNFCLIFDEAELYMHPEFQRRFIFDLINLLNNCNFDDLKSINILIATHSPYIISEIPTSNILSLEKANDNKRDNVNISYCANYYDLMKNTFLLNYSISELARTNIHELINYCNSSELIVENKIKKYELIIKNIADPYLKKILEKMLSKKKEGRK